MAPQTMRNGGDQVEGEVRMRMHARAPPRGVEEMALYRVMSGSGPVAGVVRVDWVKCIREVCAYAAADGGGPVAGDGERVKFV